MFPFLGACSYVKGIPFGTSPRYWVDLIFNVSHFMVYYLSYLVLDVAMHVYGSTKNSLRPVYFHISSVLHTLLLLLASFLFIVLGLFSHATVDNVDTLHPRLNILLYTQIWYDVTPMNFIHLTSITSLLRSGYMCDR